MMEEYDGPSRVVEQAVVRVFEITDKEIEVVPAEVARAMQGQLNRQAKEIAELRKRVSEREEELMNEVLDMLTRTE